LYDSLKALLAGAVVIVKDLFRLKYFIVRYFFQILIIVDEKIMFAMYFSFSFLSSGEAESELEHTVSCEQMFDDSSFADP
jgi:hypothetical protein